MQSVIFFGSAPLSNIVLQKLLDAKVGVDIVVTKADKPVGRHLKLTPNPLKTLALRHTIPVVESLNDLKVSCNSVGLVAAYGRIIPQEVLDKFSGRIYNIHPSLLPKYRGPSPLQQQILDGVAETGVTIIQVDAEMDHGPILAQEKDVISPTDTWVTLGERLFAKGTDAFIDFLQHPDKYSLTPQDHSQATYTKLLTRQDGYIPWEEFNQLLSNPSPLIKRKFQAFHPWPGIWSVNKHNQRTKLLAIYPKLKVQVI